MKRKNIYKLIVALALPLWGLGGLTSCSESDSELVSFVEDNRLNTPNDTVYSLIGIINKMQVIADRTVLLGELRGDLTALTEHAPLELQAIANFTAGADNPYNNARDYYAIIQNCNYFLANADTTLKKRGRFVFEKEYAVVKTYRAWTYLQLAINYGSVPFFTEPLLKEKDADPSMYPHYGVEEIADYFLKDLAPYVDTDYPEYGVINSFNSRFFYYPVRVLMGDLALWAGRYREAAQYYHDYLTKQSDPHPTYITGARWMDIDFKSTSNSYASQFGGTSSEIRTVIPMEESEYDGIETKLLDVFCSTADNNYYYQATHSKGYDELSQSQNYVLIYKDPTTQMPDTIATADTIIIYENELMRGDLRLQSIYSLRTIESASTSYSSLRQTCDKFSEIFVSILRVQHVYLRYAEALNRAGYPQAAFAVLKYGLYQQNIGKYISSAERESAGDLLSFSEYIFTRENTQGIHSRGSGEADADTLYVIPELTSLNDSILFVEDKICDEMALETAAEGLRFYDLMRLSMHRGDPTFLAGKVARRNGADHYDEALFTKLSEKKNWYLPIE